jgi:hypothetical protein
VSLLFPDRVLIALAPAALAFVRMQGVFRPRIAEKRVLECDPRFGPEPWQGAVAALAQLAPALQATRANVTVVLSNHFVRYALVPWNEGLDRSAEELAYARYCFGRIHGERSKGWEIRLSDAAAGSERLASAIDTALLQAIHACFPSGAKTRLASVQPYLMSAFNTCRARVGGEPAWLLLIEPQRACFARLDSGRWSSVRNIRGEFEGPDQWAGLLERERRLVAAGPAGNVFVHAPRATGVEEVQAGGWNFKKLLFRAPEGCAPIEDARLAAAISAL